MCKYSSVNLYCTIERKNYTVWIPFFIATESNEQILRRYERVLLQSEGLINNIFSISFTSRMFSMPGLSPPNTALGRD